MIQYEYLHAIGQDSHRFAEVGPNGKPIDPDGNRQLILGGFVIPEGRPLKANSDGDVVLHALTNAVSGITCVNILGEKADHLCLKEGIKDSSEYLALALSYLGRREITHVSFSIECKTPRLSPCIEEIRTSIAKRIGTKNDSIGITVTSGEGLSAFGKGEGIMVFCSVTVRRPFGGLSEVQPTGDRLVL